MTQGQRLRTFSLTDAMLRQSSRRGTSGKEREGYVCLAGYRLPCRPCGQCSRAFCQLCGLPEGRGRLRTQLSEDPRGGDTVSRAGAREHRTVTPRKRRGRLCALCCGLISALSARAVAIPLRNLLPFSLFKRDPGLRTKGGGWPAPLVQKGTKFVLASGASKGQWPSDLKMF